VDRDDHNKLAPLGTSGEILIEGPTLARGYLNDEAKTKSAYIEDPAWISSYDWATSTDSLPRRFYKSGDMARYNPDGSLQIIGRQDTQLKIRGQRVELGEIEVQLRRYLGMEVDVVVEGIKPAQGSGVAVVAFIAFDSEAVSADTTTQSEIMSSEDAKQKLMNMVMGIDSRLATVLPSYMIPSAYLPITRIPQTNTLKTDRKKLRQLASALSIKELNSFSAVLSAKREPATDMERTLRSIWMEVLHLSADQVSADDSFFSEYTILGLSAPH
jgi:acyl-coenzyme A synthetase/AMP-(fatty) acid ligase